MLVSYECSWLKSKQSLHGWRGNSVRRSHDATTRDGSDTLTLKLKLHTHTISQAFPLAFLGEVGIYPHTSTSKPHTPMLHTHTPHIPIPPHLTSHPPHTHTHPHPNLTPMLHTHTHTPHISPPHTHTHPHPNLTPMLHTHTHTHPHIPCPTPSPLPPPHTLTRECSSSALQDGQPRVQTPSCLLRAQLPHGSRERSTPHRDQQTQLGLHMNRALRVCVGVGVGGEGRGYVQLYHSTYKPFPTGLAVAKFGKKSFN